MDLSDDELKERFDRTLADADVTLGLACASFSSAADKAAEAWRVFHETVERHCDQLVDAMALETRDVYTALIACGTPRLDAICEAHDMKLAR